MTNKLETKVYCLSDNITEFSIEYYVNKTFKQSVISIPGHNCYHNNTELNDVIINSSSNLFNLTFHNYSNLKRVNPRYYFEDLTEYFYEFDKTIEFINEKAPDTEILLLSHSLGSLISIVYCLEGKNKNKIKKLILNGPFVSWLATFMDNFKLFCGSFIGKINKSFCLIEEDNSKWPKSYQNIINNGFDIDPLKVSDVAPAFAGQASSVWFWQNKISQNNCKLNMEIFVLRTNSTNNDKKLNVEYMDKCIKKLNSNTMFIVIYGADHDVFASPLLIRKIAYNNLNKILNY
jgi:alpha-beta hydrolase superfamily lysophospholipase